jgi:hypothetical protein
LSKVSDSLRSPLSPALQHLLRRRVGKLESERCGAKFRAEKDTIDKPEGPKRKQMFVNKEIEVATGRTGNQRKA